MVDIWHIVWWIVAVIAILFVVPVAEVVFIEVTKRTIEWYNRRTK